MVRYNDVAKNDKIYNNDNDYAVDDGDGDHRKWQRQSIQAKAEGLKIAAPSWTQAISFEKHFVKKQQKVDSPCKVKLFQCK